MNDPLSITAAAREAGGRTALIVGAQRYTFAELAAFAQARRAALDLDPHTPHALIGSNTLDTAVTLYALLDARVPVLMLHPKLTEAERQAEIDSTARAAHALPADAAAILYTSGTTGRARGAVLTRAALAASAQANAANLGWQDDDVWLAAMPIARVGGLSILTRSLIARRAVALASGFDAATLPITIEQQRVTILSVVPTMLALLLDAHPDWAPPPHLRVILLGGAAASPRLLARAAERRLPIVITYGCTETCSQVVATPYAHRFDTARHGAGRVLAGAQLRVRDGHIELRGPMRMAGYLGEPPLDPPAWFDTGDLGELDADGNLHVLARQGDLIVSGGENVYPAEVERVLEDCPGIATAGVFGLPDETWGQVVCAALVTDGNVPSPETIAAFLAPRLARHKQPRRLCFVPSLPQTAGGKLDRGALPALAAVLRPLPPAA
ncbi:MAG: AMP-binding protein [Burkholderiaceae bacterium]|nr:AMP-binding protein [Burkholderiaceae bacterium]